LPHRSFSPDIHNWIQEPIRFCYEILYRSSTFIGNNPMKLTAVNWKILAIVAGLTLSASLTACSPTPSAPDATKQGDAMKGDAMKGDGKGDAMKGDAMKSNEKKTPTTKP
jgi:hypothetical protein